MVNYEQNQSDRGETPAADAWDMSDVQFNGSDTFKIPEQGYDSRDAHEYEKGERALMEELFRISERRANILSDTGYDFVDLVTKSGNPVAGSLETSVGDIVGGKKATGKATLESFFGYIDAMYPSPYAREEDPTKNQVAAAEDHFRNMSYRESSNTADTIENLAEVFTRDGSDNDLYIANNLKHISTGSYAYHKELARTIIAYAEDPSKENRASINSVQAEHEKTLSNSLFEIAEVFNNSRTEVGKKMFDPTIALMTNLAVNDEDYIEGIMNYMKFKIGNTDINYRPDSEKERDDLKPDVFLS